MIYNKRMKFLIKTTPAFDRQARKVMTLSAQEALFDYLENDPEAGDIISGAGGIIKLRWRTGKDHKGKRGGVRILYHYTKGILALLITVYAKSDKENITQYEKNVLKKLLPELVKKYREDT